MILEIPGLVSRALPGRFDAGPLSVVRVQTTKPVFLVFATEPDCPACVVQLGPREELQRIHEALTALHERVPHLVPASLAFAPVSSNSYIHIQAGLAGTSWFRIRERYRDRQDWCRLADRAAIALRQLHAAIQESPGGRCRIRPGAALRGQRDRCLDRALRFPLHVSNLIDSASHQLDRLDDIAWFSQHGDFCLNNLMVTNDSLGIIDFEEFGETAMPLHDEFGLALSLDDFTPFGADRRELRDTIGDCIRPTLARHPSLAAHVTGFFLHHLLWRLNRCHDRPGRAVVGRQLMDLVDRFAADPARFVPEATTLARAS